MGVIIGLVMSCAGIFYSPVSTGLDAAKVKLSASDMQELEKGFKAIGVFGDRAPESLKAMEDLGTSLGTTSKGTNGKTPLLNNKN